MARALEPTCLRSLFPACSGFIRADCGSSLGLDQEWREHGLSVESSGFILFLNGTACSIGWRPKSLEGSPSSGRLSGRLRVIMDFIVRYMGRPGASLFRHLSEMATIRSRGLPQRSASDGIPRPLPRLRVRILNRMHAKGCAPSPSLCRDLPRGDAQTPESASLALPFSVNSEGV